MGARDVLIVQDDPHERQSLAEVLESSGYRVATAANGWQALELAAARPPDLILLDLSMPAMSGSKVIDVLNADDVLRQIPILVLSGEVDVPQNVVAISKPFRMEQVLGLMECLLEAGGRPGRPEASLDAAAPPRARGRVAQE
jgi:CheY-like chemotaxis protein